MVSLDAIKRQVRKLYEINPHIHVNLSMTRPKLQVQNAEAVIKGIYANVFRVEDHSGAVPRCYTVPYTDILTKQIEIVELKLTE